MTLFSQFEESSLYKFRNLLDIYSSRLNLLLVSRIINKNCKTKYNVSINKKYLKLMNNKLTYNKNTKHEL